MSFNTIILQSGALNAEEGIFQIMWSNAPFFTTIIIVAVLFGYLGYKISRIYHRFEKTEKDCSTLNSNTTQIFNQITGVDKKLTVIITYLVGEGFNPAIFTSHSPIELNKLGYRILEDIGGKKYIDENSESLVKIIEGKGVKSGLDVQNYSNIILSEKLLEDGFVPIKNYIFQNPIYKVSEDKNINLDLGIATQIIGIYLRNKYFEKYPDLKKDL